MSLTLVENLLAPMPCEKISEEILATLREKAQTVRALCPTCRMTRTGAWLWVDGSDETYAAREVLKSEGFRWAKRKAKWYFAGRPATNRRAMGWDYITAEYGEEEL